MSSVERITSEPNNNQYTHSVEATQTDLPPEEKARLLQESLDQAESAIIEMQRNLRNLQSESKSQIDPKSVADFPPQVNVINSLGSLLIESSKPEERHNLMDDIENLNNQLNEKTQWYDYQMVFNLLNTVASLCSTFGEILIKSDPNNYQLQILGKGLEALSGTGNAYCQAGLEKSGSKIDNSRKTMDQRSQLDADTHSRVQSLVQALQTNQSNISQAYTAAARGR